MRPKFVLKHKPILQPQIEVQPKQRLQPKTSGNYSATQPYDIQPSSEQKASAPMIYFAYNSRRYSHQPDSGGCIHYSSNIPSIFRFPIQLFHFHTKYLSMELLNIQATVYICIVTSQEYYLTSSNPPNTF